MPDDLVGLGRWISVTEPGRERLIGRRKGEDPAATVMRMRPKDRPLANDAVNVEGLFDRLLGACFGNLAVALEPRLECRALASKATQGARGAALVG